MKPIIQIQTTTQRLKTLKFNSLFIHEMKLENFHICAAVTTSEKVYKNAEKLGIPQKIKKLVGI
jgi:hypothetical protein